MTDARRCGRRCSRHPRRVVKSSPIRRCKFQKVIDFRLKKKTLTWLGCRVRTKSFFFLIIVGIQFDCEPKCTTQNGRQWDFVNSCNTVVTSEWAQQQQLFLDGLVISFEIYLSGPILLILICCPDSFRDPDPVPLWSSTRKCSGRNLSITTLRRVSGSQ